MRRCTVAVVFAASVSVAALPSVASADLSSEKLTLNAFENSSQAIAGPVTTSDVLTNGKWYFANVYGLYSGWNKNLMGGITDGFKVCGTPVDGPKSWAISGLLGADSERIFALPKLVRQHCPPTPRSHQGFVTRLETNDSFVHPQTSGKLDSHRYGYFVRGQGDVAQFGLRDSNLTDNYGKFSIALRLATPADCVFGDYQFMEFASQSECESALGGGGSTT